MLVESSPGNSDGSGILCGLINKPYGVAIRLPDRGRQNSGLGHYFDHLLVS